MSPEGNGADCHRTWEALLLGCIPIVKKTYMGSGLYDGLPVVYVNEWSEITPDRLAAEWSKYVNAPKGTYRFEKLFADYWVDRIKAENFEGVVVKGRKGRVADVYDETGRSTRFSAGSSFLSIRQSISHRVFRIFGLR